MSARGRGAAAAAGVILCGLVACSYGSNVRSFAPARRPHGAQVVLNGTVRGELLLVHDSAVVIGVGGAGAMRAMVVPARGIRTATVTGLGADYEISAFYPARAVTWQRWRLVSRYPAGLAPPLWQTLLQSFGQTAPDTLR